MSIQAVGAVLDYSQSVKGTRLTAISLANHADKHGICFPSVRLAAEEAKLSRRAVKEAIKMLRGMGELVVLIESDGKTHRPPLYWIALEGLSGRLDDDHAYFLVFGTRAELMADPGADSAPGPGEGSAPGPGADSAPPGCEKDPHPGANSARAPYREPSVEPSDNPTDDSSVGYLSNLLADLIAANDPNHLRPTVGQEWLDAERLMLNKDERDIDQAEHVLRWCQADEFWRGNVQSMVKFRKQYGQLFLKANRQPRRSAAPERSKPKPDNVYDLGVVRSG